MTNQLSSGGPLDDSTNSPSGIFRRAFWRAPSPSDRILKAQRKQESLPNGLVRWSSYLSIEASPGLLKYIQEENTLGLVSVDEANPPLGAPTWFKFDPENVRGYATHQGGLKVYVPKTGNFVFALSVASVFVGIVPEPPAVDISRKWPTTFEEPNPEYAEIFQECLGMTPLFDRIIHAQSVETMLSSGKRRVDSYLVVEASDSLIERFENDPQLIDSKSGMHIPPGAPDWFTTNSYDKTASNYFFFSVDFTKEGNLLYIRRTRFFPK